MMGFDRAYARGPWRAVPAPAFLADREAGLRFQLAWAAGVLVVLALLALALGGESRGLLLRGGSLGLICEHAVPALLLGLGMAVAVAWGGLDLSAGAAAALAGVVFAQQANPALGLLAALGCGLVNGLLVAALRVPGWLVTGATLPIVHALTRALAGATSPRVDVGAFAWLGTTTRVLSVVAAVAAVVWLQALPRGAPPARQRWGRLADALPYLLSAGLAGLGGLHGAMRLGIADAGAGAGDTLDPLLVAVLGGTFLGGGRTSAVGTVVAALGLAAVRFAATVGHASSWVQGIVVQLLLVLGLLASAAAHALAARRYAPLPPPQGAEGERGARAFDRGLFNGPGRTLPIPVHLIDRRWALRIELSWSAALIAALAVLAGATAVILPGGHGWGTLAGVLGRDAVVPLLLALGGCAVVARGGWDLSGPMLAFLAATLAAHQGDPWGALILGATVGLANGALVALARVPGWLATAPAALVLAVARLLTLWRPAPGPVASPAQGWLLTAGPIVAAVAAAGAVAWLQVHPGRDLDLPLVRWRVRLGDGLPYVFSGVLAAAAGVYLVQRVGGISPRLSAGGEALPIVVLAGCWLGAGRANVLGVVLATALVVGIQHLFALADRDGARGQAVLGVLVLLALVASRVVHVAVARAYARALAAAPRRALTGPTHF